MRIALIAQHSWPLRRDNGKHTGDVVILDLAHGLRELGHHVEIVAPAETDWPQVMEMRSSRGQYPPSSEECEEHAFGLYAQRLWQFDVVHDFSNTKRIALQLQRQGYRHVVMTLMGGPWRLDSPPVNLCVWSHAHRDRVLRGATDYEGTSHPSMGGPPGNTVRDAHVVYGGVDTDYYCREGAKGQSLLWLNRWHPAKGYVRAIQLAKDTGIELVVAGTHPDDGLPEAERQCAIEAEQLVQGWANISIQHLPPDPRHHNAKRALYRQARALLYTIDFQEPFGLAQVEALACGTPVIAARMGSCPEIIQEDVNGYLCTTDAEWRKAVKRTMPWRKVNADRFSRRKMAEGYEAEYKQVCAGVSW